MAGLLSIIFWAAAYSAAWWGAPLLGKFFPESSPTGFNVIRVVLSIVFWLIAVIGRILWGLLIYLFDGVDHGTPIGGGYVIVAIIFGWRLGTSRGTELTSIVEEAPFAAPVVAGVGRGMDAAAAPSISSEGVALGDPYAQAGQELLSGNVDPGIWARALVEGGGEDRAVKAVYARLRVAMFEELPASATDAISMRPKLPENVGRREAALRRYANEWGASVSEVVAGFAQRQKATESQARVMIQFGIVRDGGRFVVYLEDGATPQYFDTLFEAARFAFVTSPKTPIEPLQLRGSEELLDLQARDELSTSEDAGTSAADNEVISQHKPWSVIVRPPASGSSSLIPKGVVNGKPYRFGEASLRAYGRGQLATVKRVLNAGSQRDLIEAHASLIHEIGWQAGKGDERTFLTEYYMQACSILDKN